MGTGVDGVARDAADQRAGQRVDQRQGYREALEAVVQAKVEGNDVVRPAGLELPETKKQPADLTEILRASVAAVKTGRGKTDDGKADGGKAGADAKEDAPAKTTRRRKASA
ncbi:MAG: hypothetical protein ACLQB1_21075 [Streptosporangiaceae bacterium]